jgi:hypothetical protein
VSRDAAGLLPPLTLQERSLLFAAAKAAAVASSGIMRLEFISLAREVLRTEVTR